MLQPVMSALKGKFQIKQDEAERAERRYADFLIALTNQANFIILGCCTLPVDIPLLMISLGIENLRG